MKKIYIKKRILNTFIKMENSGEKKLNKGVK